MTRTYTLKRRAARMAQTRRRIAAATWELHRTVGPARTTISAIARRAGVQRLTVYQHFPDERSLFRACQAHEFATNPPPDAAAWAVIPDPEARLRVALADLYAYYRRSEAILANVERDAPTLPALQQVVAEGSAGFQDTALRILLDGWDDGGPHQPLRRAALGHALAFQTWRSLVRDHGLTADEAAALMVALVRCRTAPGDAVAPGRQQTATPAPTRRREGAPRQAGLP